jgi:hypothetical protein
VSNDFRVRVEHDLLMRVEPPAQSREVDDDHPSCHDRRPFVPRG